MDWDFGVDSVAPEKARSTIEPFFWASHIYHTIITAGFEVAQNSLIVAQKNSALPEAVVVWCEVGILGGVRDFVAWLHTLAPRLPIVVLYTADVLGQSGFDGVREHVTVTLPCDIGQPEFLSTLRRLVDEAKAQGFKRR